VNHVGKKFDWEKLFFQVAFLRENQPSLTRNMARIWLESAIAETKKQQQLS
jgi:hypothetical protein